MLKIVETETNFKASENTVEAIQCDQFEIDIFWLSHLILIYYPWFVHQDLSNYHNTHQISFSYEDSCLGLWSHELNVNIICDYI